MKQGSYTIEVLKDGGFIVSSIATVEAKDPYAIPGNYNPVPPMSPTVTRAAFTTMLGALQSIATAEGLMEAPTKNYAEVDKPHEPVVQETCNEANSVQPNDSWIKRDTKVTALVQAVHVGDKGESPATSLARAKMFADFINA